MGVWIIKALVISLVLTLILELLFAVVAGVREKKDILLVCLVNVLTNPCVVLIHYLVLFYIEWNLVIVTLLLETGAVLVEGIYYKKYSVTIKHPFLFSLGANVFSYVTGQILNRLI